MWMGTFNTAYDFNYVGGKSISVTVKTVTEIIVDDDFKNDLFVGETIDLQQGNTFVRESESPDDPLVPDAYPPGGAVVYMSVDGVADISTLLDVIPDGDGVTTNDCRVVGGD